MEELINLGIYIAICAGIFGIVFGGVYLKKKFNIKEKDLELAEKIISLLIYISGKIDFKYNGDIKQVAIYTLEAIDIINQYEDLITIDEKKELIQNEALEICREHEVNVDLELINAISEIVNYFV